MNAIQFEAGIAVHGAYLHAIREAAAGMRHDNAVVFEWAVKITGLHPSLSFRSHRPCRPRHIVVQVLLCCNYVPGIALEMVES